MSLLSYKDLQEADVKVQRMVYGWVFKFGPFIVRPDINDNTRRRVINYYWRKRCLLTSTPRYVVLHLAKRFIVIDIRYGILPKRKHDATV